MDGCGCGWTSALQEIASVVVPDVAGWDLVTLPPSDGALGIDRKTLMAYLEGQGPAPSLDVSLRRQGRSLRVMVDNQGPFASVVSTHGNWLEVSLKSGYLVADDPGSFDRIVLGKQAGGQWKPGIQSGVNAARYFETFVGGNEQLETGLIRLPSSRSGNYRSVVCDIVRWFRGVRRDGGLKTRFLVRDTGYRN